MAVNELDEDDIKGIVAALREMRTKPNPKKKRTIKDVMREPEMWELITGCKDAGYSNAEIVDAINANAKGFKTTPGTFGSYYSEISREMTPNAAKPKAKTSRAAASKPAETSSDQSAETSAKPETKTPETGSGNTSKPETKAPVNPAQRDRKSL